MSRPVFALGIETGSPVAFRGRLRSSPMPSLSTFIRQNTEQILAEWESFARTLPPGTSMSISRLRDHAEAMLDVIATDLETPQTADQQSDKSKGLGPIDSSTPRTAASRHGRGRAASGFSVEQMVAEFRALRATVIRLWTAHEPTFGPAQFEDLIRFNEAIDQAIAESLERYSGAVEETRDRFLAVLGHDLRNPLGAIATSAGFLLETGPLTPDQATLIRGIGSAERRMSRLIEDLIQLALNRLGDGMPITRSATDAAAVIHNVVAEVRASHPNARIETHLSGTLTGQLDEARLAQALTNLLGNAVHHGDPGASIDVEARGDDREIVISVHNRGPAIPPEKVGRLLSTMKRGRSESRDRRHLGLGLFIVDKIVEGHGGALDVQSTPDQGTTFAMRLPRST
jgi:signal transduction histidine kinase